ncbi:membrane or secreted protein, partial [Candidatus Magnetobacterium bavaricum]
MKAVVVVPVVVALVFLVSTPLLTANSGAADSGAARVPILLYHRLGPVVADS